MYVHKKPPQESSSALLKVIDSEKNFENSNHLQLLSFNDLPLIILDGTVLRNIKKTRRFQKEGNTWFYGLSSEYSGSILQDREYLFAINYSAQKPEDVFRKISNKEEWEKFPFSQRMRFFEGGQPMQVGIYDEEKHGSDAFIEIHRSLPPINRAPITVCMEKSRVSPEK